MSFVVVSSHESSAGKDLQQPGDSVAVLPALSTASARFAARSADLAAAAGAASSSAGEGPGTIWVMLLELPVPAEDIDEALETLEIIIEETDDIAGELGDLVIDYFGAVFTAAGAADYPRERAIDDLQAWLS